jgi:hypothetical protein
LANPYYGRNRTDNLRKFHDQLGWQAWGKLEKGGLCAGTIFRTRDFIQIKQAERCGSRNGQTVHIEHTVPIEKLSELNMCM